ncbi:PREDICTED: enhancer of split mbeta protein-like [Polistes dominula]|uniref:Enhancer of split mbeta protein-like n=1 Tax=Polistes dominula TaxID=743375 RepID=A0ABM1HUL5_POLDO|nr:PREDICTED: enhancer of split mbeta protein-like [Polistes dominula]
MAPHTSYAPITSMEYEEPVSRTYQYRKITKPLLERKRRARINRCLDELKDLMVAVHQSEGENVAKFEKADILEMTVHHLQTLRAAHRLTLTPENSYADRFRDGFTQCAQEVSKFLSSPVAATVHPNVGAQLMRHLGGCLRRLEGCSPTTTNSNSISSNNSSTSPIPSTSKGYNEPMSSPTTTTNTSTSTATTPSTMMTVCIPQNIYTPPHSPISVVSSSGESIDSTGAIWRPW